MASDLTCLLNTLSVFSNPRHLNRELILHSKMREVVLALALRGFAILVIGAIARFSYNLYHRRMRFRSLASKYDLVGISLPGINMFD